MLLKYLIADGNWWKQFNLYKSITKCYNLEKGYCMFMDNDGMTLATEIFAELKRNARRWFIAFLVMVALEIGTVIGFIYYYSLPVEEVNIENDDGNANYIGNDMNGDITNGEDNN